MVEILEVMVDQMAANAALPPLSPDGRQQTGSGHLGIGIVARWPS